MADLGNTTNNANLGLTTAESLISWYWLHGSKRISANAISAGWLRGVYSTRDLLRSIELGNSNQQASLGLWGPSQSGKSTLISNFVDQGANAAGRGGLLDWDQAALFSSRPLGDENPGIKDEIVVFNPHNMNSDASGCVSRFVLREDSDLPHHGCPVEIRLLNNPQILHAISAGYHSECKAGLPWTIDAVEKIIDGYSKGLNDNKFDQSAFESLHELISVLELLLESQDSRFTQLDSDGKWPTLVARILDSPALLSNKTIVMEFAAKMLWGGEELLTNLYGRLLSLKKTLPTSKTYCSLEIAATLVNIDSFKIFMQKASDKQLASGAQKIRDSVRSMSWKKYGTDVLIGKFDGEQKLLSKDSDFGLFQALVRELVIPLRIANARKSNVESSSFIAFMTKADLVDFPGLANRDKNAQELQLDLESFADEDDPRLLTEVMKRGKVASLVNGYSKTLSLDSFVILARAGRYVPKVEQLHLGLSSWWKFVDPEFNPYNLKGKRPPLPLFFNLTFFAEVVDKVVDGAAAAGLMGVADQLSQLLPFVSPEVSTFIASTYPQFKDGRIVAPPNARKTAIEAIKKDNSFAPFCKQTVSQESLQKLIVEADGGVGFLFEVLSKQASSAERLRLLEIRKRDVLMDLVSQIEEQTPRQGNAQCIKDVEQLKSAISASLKSKSNERSISDPAAWVSYRLRKFLDIESDRLAPLPPSKQQSHKYLEYVDLQITRWIESKSDFDGLKDLGIRDAGLKTRLLEFLSTRINREQIATWIRTQLPSERRQEDNQELRRVLAALISNQLVASDGNKKQHPQVDGKGGVIETIRAWALAEESHKLPMNFRESPHFTAVILPIVKLFDQLAKGEHAARPPQPGDKEALALLQDAQSCIP